MILNFPVGRQTFNYDCGVKALQLVLAYYGIDVREDRLLKELQCNANGVLINNLVETGIKYGLHTEARPDSRIEDLKKHISSGHPVILLLQAWAGRPILIKDWHEINQFGHYVVMIGLEDQKLIFADPSSFQRTWLYEDELSARWHFEVKGLNVNLNRMAVYFSGKDPIDLNEMVHMD
jgi:ABC-type bacteriocin/lantibiotic exporter with double-glycine peptidase domain